MKNKELHPVRFSKKQVRFIEHMIHGKIVGLWGKECGDIISTIEKSEKGGSKPLSKPLTEGKMLCGTKKQTTSRPPFGPPGQGKSNIKRCQHLNIRFINMGPRCCPDCHRHVWPREVINVLLDLLHVRPTH